MSFTVSRSRWSDVYLDAGARFFAQTGLSGAMTALLLQLEGSGAGGIAVGAMTIATMLPMVVLSPITGRIADRCDSRYLIVAAGIIRAFASVALAFVVSPAAIVALVVVLSTGTALLQPTLAALVPSMVTRDDLPRAAATIQTSGTIGMMAGPAMAGLLAGFFGTQAAMWVNAACALVTVTAGLLIRTRRGGQHRATDVTEALLDTPTKAPSWSLRDDALIRVVTMGLAAIIGVVSAVNVVEVFFIRDTLGASELLYGIVSTAWAAGMAIGAWMAGRLVTPQITDGRLTVWLFAWLTATTAAVLVMGGIYGSAWWIVPLMLTGGLFNGADNTALGVLFGRRVPETVRGRAQAMLQARVQGAALVGFAAAAVALEVLSPRTLVLACGIGGLIVIAALAPWIRRAVTASDAAATPAAHPEPEPEPVGT